MKHILKPGAVHQFRYRVPIEKTVPHLYPESPQFRAMPEVFATGFMVGLIEWACIQALEVELEPGEGSLGTFISVSHLAATPPGMTVTVTVNCSSVEGRQLSWAVVARDEREVIGEGHHTRTVVRWDRFLNKVAEKAATIGA